MALYLPTIYYSVEKKTSNSALSTNSLYKYAWDLIYYGHLALYSFPGLLWFISFAAFPGFNSLYVQYSQYVTYLTGVFLSLTATGLFAASYV